ncbi:putative membrane protein [Kineosphaera limosa]|uniref:YdbS-like PH domain-containing protein n=1 Tax=Kineosphaera limosa NBRC 100340 TaxID=1184609 RepID=K6WDM6_9MICO|nr:PH domain-containing protein [Kineosphaera limosa]NYE00646.1 putative membrane protein [Kineosphaera limosa]GAB97380.1 hypothetical protein KILIM_066_00210 [Kineosphaera limosa NBRC 100340]
MSGDLNHDAAPPVSPPQPTVRAATDSWRRLDRRMLLIEPVQAVVRFLPALVVVVFAGSAGRSAPWWTNLAAVIFPIALGILSWLTTSYRITDEHLQVRRGLLQRTTLTARLDRIRTVDVTASPLHRLLRVAAVRVGTGGERPFVLDGLPAEQARALREDLLHVARSQTPPGDDPATTGADPANTAADRAPSTADPDSTVSGALATNEPESELAVFDAGWIRFAPFSLTGLATMLAAIGVGLQFLGELTRRALESEIGSAAYDYATGLTLTMAIVQGVLGVLVVFVVASIVAYVLRYWGYRLTRHSAGTLGVTRGLLTTRTTSLEERRLRGVRVTRPFLVGLVGGAKADALVIGSANQESGSDLLVPPAPREVVTRVAGRVLRDPEPLTVSLEQHGPAARRRRYTRSLALPIVVAALTAPLWWWLEWTWLWVLPVVALAVAPVLARARYARLGHALVGDHLVARSGLFPEHTDAIGAGGIIGWNVSESFFQRRVGLVTLSATLAAGGGKIEVLDVPWPRALAVMRATTPGMLDDFLP